MSIVVNLEEAEADFIRLVERAAAGEDIMIAGPGKLRVRLEPVGIQPAAPKEHEHD